MMLVGWKCPVCGSGVAPGVERCPCMHQVTPQAPPDAPLRITCDDDVYAVTHRGQQVRVTGGMPTTLGWSWTGTVQTNPQLLADCLRAERERGVS